MNTQPHAEEFLLLYSSCEERLFAYLMTLLGHRDDAEEVFQETTLVLWRSFNQFTHGTNFFAWAKQIAFNRVLTYRKQKRRSGVPHSEEVLRAIDRVASSRAEVLDARLVALSQCVEKLPEADRRLVAVRYGSNCKVKDAAIQLGRPANTLYKALERIRHALIECVERAILNEGQT